MNVFRRRKGTTAESTTRPQVDRELSALTAASAAIPPPKWGKATKPKADARKWQAESWDMLELVGELSFALLWKTALLSRFRLVASDLDPETGKPTGSTDNMLARQIVRQIAGGATGQSQMLGRLAPLMMIPGEGWLVIIYPEGVEQWHILSNDEIKARGETVELTLHDGTTYLMDKTTDTLARIWRHDPRRASLAWSPVKAALPILREIVRMSQNIEGAGKSRQAGNGILVVPTEMSMPARPAPTGAPDPDAPGLPIPSRHVGAGELHQQLKQVMATAIADPASAEALVPIILQVAGEHVKNIQHIKFDSEVSEKAQAARENAVRRLAMTLDMPPEVMLGLADLNHWSLYGVEEEAVRWHAAPEMETICAALTEQLLTPLIGDAEVVIWYDTSDVEAEPDQVEKVGAAYELGVANSAAYMRELGLSVDTDGYDLTTKDGWILWLTDQIRKDATLAPSHLPMLSALAPGLQLPELPAAPTPPQPPVVEAEPSQPRVPDTRDQQAAAADSVVRLCVNQAMRLAGNRRRTRTNHGQLQDVSPMDTHLHNHLGPCPASDVDRLISGWDEVLDDEICASAGVSRTELRTLVASISREALTTGTRPMWRAEP